MFCRWASLQEAAESCQGAGIGVNGAPTAASVFHGSVVTFSFALGAAMFVIGDVEPHAVGDKVNFWGAEWWKNNFMNGLVSPGVASFKGYASSADNFCGGVWSTRPGNSPPPPAAIGQPVLIIVTSTVRKVGPRITGDIQKILTVNHDGRYDPNPGHPGHRGRRPVFFVRIT